GNPMATCGFIRKRLSGQPCNRPRSAAPSSAREEVMPEDKPPRGGGETILIVEDEPVLTLMLTDVLEELGHDVVAASSGQQALNIVKSIEPFDLLLTDVVMPDKIGGFELEHRVRKIRPTFPIIYTSG
ncbi:MAG: response regulator, partial [Pseudomonadota bacterium]